ncbi:uncharacterized protein ARMOST_18268 [Armillaria ostoyae]|uniref:Uncharacterized protein n=1 Tax=Armillaria ostoyae TaxID=47428 RepID=A0A284S1E2_ARMOS|nr:uncharacterized protein ARMOST_18268 [Armillaria ostoyae]
MEKNIDLIYTTKAKTFCRLDVAFHESLLTLGAGGRTLVLDSFKGLRPHLKPGINFKITRQAATTTTC